MMMSMLHRAAKGSAVVRQGVARAELAAARAFSSDAPAGGDKPQRPPRKQNQQNKKNQVPREKRDKGEAGGERKFLFALRGKTNEEGKRGDESAASAQPQQNQQRKKKFSFAPSVKAKEKSVELEHFDHPAYWNEDFPADFDDAMKHEVEKLEIFADFTMLIDSSWQNEIHPLFDGSKIELVVNAPLEDYNERLFIDDKNTYDTKVVMKVPLTCFTGLTSDGLEFVKQLAGPRYNANKKHIKITEDRYPTRVFNHKRLCDILRDITQTAHELSTKGVAQAEN